MLQNNNSESKLFYGWVIALLFLVIQFTILGISSSFGIFFKSIESEFNLTRITTSSIYSLSMILVIVFSIIGGWALDKYGPKVVLSLMGFFTGLSLVLTSHTSSAWQIFITYSLIMSMGSSATYVVTMSTVSRWFDKKRGFAVGIAGSGGALGMVVIAPLATFLIGRFDWQIAYLVLGLIAWVVVIPVAQFLKKDPYEVGQLPDGQREGSVSTNNKDTKINAMQAQIKELSIREAVRTRGFWLVILIWILFAFCMMLVLMHIVPHATDIGISTLEAAVLISLIGGTRAAGMIVLGGTGDRLGRKGMAIICALLQAGAMLWLILADQMWMLCLFAIVYGLTNGGLLSSVTAILGDVFGLCRIGTVLGVLDIGWAIGAASGPLIAGFIYDIYNDYSLAFLFGAISMATIAIVVTFIKLQGKVDYSGICD